MAKVKVEDTVPVEINTVLHADLPWKNYREVLLVLTDAIGEVEMVEYLSLN